MSEPKWKNGRQEYESIKIGKFRFDRLAAPDNWASFVFQAYDSPDLVSESIAIEEVERLRDWLNEYLEVVDE